MNETKYTPGPWHIEPDNRVWDTKHAIAAIYNMSAPEPMAGEAIANAQLIAAAPELLAACQATEAWIACNVFPPEVRHMDELRKLHVVIAKATGQDIPAPAISENLNQALK